MAEFLSVFEDYGLSDLTELACQSDGCLLVVMLESPIPTEILAALDDLAC